MMTDACFDCHCLIWLLFGPDSFLLGPDKDQQNPVCRCYRIGQRVQYPVLL